jgi:hypothetical protein
MPWYTPRTTMKKKKTRAKRAGGVVQSPEFKPQYCQKEKKIWFMTSFYCH